MLSKKNKANFRLLLYLALNMKCLIRAVVLWHVSVYLLYWLLILVYILWLFLSLYITGWSLVVWKICCGVVVNEHIGTVVESVSYNPGFGSLPAVYGVLPDENNLVDVNPPQQQQQQQSIWLPDTEKSPTATAWIFASSWLVAGCYFLSFCYTVW